MKRVKTPVSELMGSLNTVKMEQLSSLSHTCVSDFGVKSNNNSIVNIRGLSQIVNSIQKFVSPILLWSDPAAPSGHHPSERREQSSSHSSKCQPPHTIVTTLYSGHSLQFRIYPRNRLRLEIEHYVISEDSAVNWCDVTI